MPEERYTGSTISPDGRRNCSAKRSIRPPEPAWKSNGWAVDYIITHCCPTSAQDELGTGFYQADALTDFLEEVAQKCHFRYWFFGHYHDNRIVREKFVLLYEQIVLLKS